MLDVLKRFSRYRDHSGNAINYSGEVGGKGETKREKRRNNVRREGTRDLLHLIQRVSHY